MHLIPVNLFARVALLVSGMVLATASMAQAPIGELEIRGSAEIGDPDGVGMVRINNSNYTWFSGDHIRMREGTAILTLDDDHSFGFVNGTEAALSIESDRVLIDLDAGMLLYAIEGNDVEVLVNQEHFVGLATASQELEPCHGLNAAGLLHVAGNFELEVIVQTGVLEGATNNGSVEYVVAPGERVLFTEDNFVVTEIELPADVEQQLADMGDSDSLPCIIWWQREEQALGVINGLTAGQAALIGGSIGAGVGVGVYRVYFEDDDDCPVCPPDPVTP